MRKNKIIELLPVFLLLIFSSCHKEEDLYKPYYLTKEGENLVAGTLHNGDPVGLWTYKDLYGATIKKIDYQIKSIGMTEVASVDTYYSPDKIVLSIYGVKPDTTSFEIYGMRSSKLDNKFVGEVLSKEYCKSCHNVFTRSLSQPLKDYYDKGDLTSQNIRDHKSVTDSKLLSDRLSKIPQDQIDLIIEFIESEKRVKSD